MFDANAFTTNQNEMTYEQLAPYHGKCVAWSFDGKRALAAAATREELYAEVDRLGITEYVTQYVDLSPNQIGWLSGEASEAAGDPISAAG
jgi:hypothetical protein